MSNVPIILRGKIIKGEKYYFNERLAKLQYEKLEGKEFEEILQEKREHISSDQYAYYFGGIIAGTCMKATIFEGWTKEEIDQYFCNELLSLSKVRMVGGKVKQITTVRQKSELSMKEFAEFVDNVINLLAMEHQIAVLPPEDYKLGKYKTRVA